MFAKARYTLISAALGWLGSINIVLIGIHVTTFYLQLAVLSRSFLTGAYVMGGIATVSTLTLVFGSYLIFVDSARRGGVLNLAGGIITLILCYYFTSTFPLLRQLEPIAYLLPAPALASGLLALFMLKSGLQYF
ncbi:MAG: hypothetical protein OEX76_01455 [Candidatus Bathyarchaeota archaeon]|nr:hypothetical protein [Candidatus Bathyarchaeota archaeon]MDH5531928.1 hypothetical protein [Candidatus Bathyarchaeota archaeon]MDH5712493.1 hypothetical protein [Candidatus Bathyarchaeota archaeon]